MFDIRQPGELREGVNYHLPFSTPLPVSPYKLALPGIKCNLWYLYVQAHITGKKRVTLSNPITT